MDAGRQTKMDSAAKPGGLENKTIIGTWALVLLMAVIAYLPGLKGPFLFDDFGEITALGARGGVVNWATFKAFVFGGHGGPTGRPLPLLSFLIDGSNWPTDAWPFKRTNLVIHLINAVLLGVLIDRLLELLQIDRQRRHWVALISTSCWLLHPFLVSTTLYVVQRMAQLSTLFIFAGFISYLHGRSLLAANRIKAYLVMSISLGVFTLLSTISKENGLLLPLLIGTLEITVIASQQARLAALNRYWAVVFIVLPTVLIAVYLGEKMFRDDFFTVVPPRDFSIYERLLTQPRILTDYLRHWFVPDLYTVGIFQDHFSKSTGLLSPLTTLLGVVLHLAMIGISIAKRRRWPLFSFAILFFYTSHLLESSVLNLELYFEHRNYLAAALLFVPPVLLLQSKVSRSLFLVVAGAVVLLLAGFTRYTATIWQDYPSIVEAAAQKAPTSARAQMLYATELYNVKRFDESVQVIDKAIEVNPGNQSLKISRSAILCNIGTLGRRDFENTSRDISTIVYDPRSVRIYTLLNSSVAAGKCPDVGAESLRTLYVNMLAVPENGDPASLRFSQIKYFIGFADVHLGEPARAASAFEESLTARPGAGHAMMMAAVMATNEYHDEALYFSAMALEQLGDQDQGLLQGARVNESDIHAFREIVRENRDAARE